MCEGKLGHDYDLCFFFRVACLDTMVKNSVLYPHMCSPLPRPPTNVFKLKMSIRVW